MNGKKVILLVGALVIAVATALMAKSMFAGSSAPEAQAAEVPLGPKVLVARKGLQVGTLIDAEALAYQAWPAEMVENAYYTDEEGEDMSALIGTVVRSPITAGQPVTRGSLVGPGDRGFLAAALSPGMRAITVPINPMRGAGGFIMPGDRVDMILTQAPPADEYGPNLKTSETIVRNLRVLATDRRTGQHKNEEGQVVVSGYNSMTFEVTPKLAEKIQLAQNLGELSLVLRSIADDKAELERAIAAGEIKVPDDVSEGEERAILVQLANRPTDTETTFTTGGQVSRFHRSSITPKPKAVPAGAPVSTSGPAAAVAARPTVRVARGKSVSTVSVGSN